MNIGRTTVGIPTPHLDHHCLCMLAVVAPGRALPMFANTSMQISNHSTLQSDHDVFISDFKN